MKRGTSLLLALFAFMAAGANRAAGATLYGATAGNSPTGDFYIIDPVPGGIFVGPIGFGVTGLAYDPLSGVLYDPRPINRTRQEVIRIDPATGAGTLVGSYGFPGQTMADLTFTPDGTLYGWLEPTAENLYRIDPATGAATLVGESGLIQTSGSGLAANSFGVLFFAGKGAGGQLDIISPVTGLASFLLNLDDPDLGVAINALAFSPTGVLYGVERNAPYNLVTINTTTGHVTDLGPTVNCWMPSSLSRPQCLNRPAWLSWDADFSCSDGCAAASKTRASQRPQCATRLELNSVACRVDREFRVSKISTVVFARSVHVRRSADPVRTQEFAAPYLALMPHFGDDLPLLLALLFFSWHTHPRFHPGKFLDPL